MNNTVVCKSCGCSNPFHQLTCISCKSYLRERVYNIDLWKTLEYLIESPVKAFTRIIHSEQKNFVVFILLISAVKFFLNSIFFFLIYPQNQLLHAGILRNYIASALAAASVITIFTYFIYFTGKALGNSTRVKDIFSILTYALFPNVFALIILFPLELIFFGEYLFSNNPSPFAIKEITAYVMLAFELLILIWTFFLAILAVYTLSRNFLYSSGFGLIFICAIYFVQYLLSFYLFTH
jgi:hypothetical protein